MKNSKKLLNIIFAAIFAYTCSQYTSELNATIPIKYKQLYTLFTKDGDTTFAIDTIGIGQSLLYSNWIENVYTYASESNAARKIIEILWFKRLQETDGTFVETENFGPQNYDPVKSLNAKDIGLLIKYIRTYQPENPLNENNRKKLSSSLSVKRGTNKKKKLIELRTALEEIKTTNENFMPEMAECILWAFFESKFDGEENFKTCLQEVDPSALEKLKDEYTKLDLCKMNINFNEENAKNTIEKIIQKILQQDNCSQDVLIKEYNKLTFYLINASKIKNMPPKVSQTNLKCKNLLTNVESEDPFPTCFESSILDLISILIYNTTTKKYDPNILPETIRSSETFKNLINQVFKTIAPAKTNLDDKEFIAEKNINKSMPIWINIISNLPELKYKNNNNQNRYDLNPSFENLVKVLNKFLNLGFIIIDKINTLEVTNNNSNPEFNKITVEKDNIESWQKLFDIISEKLSTKDEKNTRPVKLLIEKNKIEKVEFKKINRIIGDSICIGAIKISIGKINFHLSITASQIVGHAKIICPGRDVSKIAENHLENIKNMLFYDINKYKNLTPLFILLPYIQTMEKHPQIEQLLYYSFNLKDHNSKAKLLKKILSDNNSNNDNNLEIIRNIYMNKDLHNLVIKLINLIPENDTFFTEKLISYYYNNKNNYYFGPEILLKINSSIEKSQDSIFLGNTLISSAGSQNNELVNKLLENKNTNINSFLILDGKKIEWTPLSMACIKNCIETVKILLKHPKIDVNIACENKSFYGAKKTPIILAYENNNEEILDLLLKHQNINTNIQNSSQETLLQRACSDGNEKILSKLINHPKTNIFIKDNNNQTAKDIAKNCKDSIKEFLQNPDYAYTYKEEDYTKYEEIINLLEQKEKEINEQKEQVKQFTHNVIQNIKNKLIAREKKL